MYNSIAESSKMTFSVDNFRYILFWIEKVLQNKLYHFLGACNSIASESSKMGWFLGIFYYYFFEKVDMGLWRVGCVLVLALHAFVRSRPVPSHRVRPVTSRRLPSLPSYPVPSRHVPSCLVLSRPVSSCRGFLTSRPVTSRDFTSHHSRHVASRRVTPMSTNSGIYAWRLCTG